MAEYQRRPVRVLQVLAGDAIAGTELMLASLVERSDPSRIEHELATLSSLGPIGKRLRSAGVAVHSLGDCGVLRGATRIGRLLRHRRFDVINLYGFRAGLAGRIAARFARPRPKVVVGVRGLLVTEVERVDSPKARIAEAIEHATAGLVDVYDANSPGAAERLEHHGVPRERIVYIPNGIELDGWQPRTEGEGGSSPVIACVARFVPRKRHVDLIEALAQLERDGVAFEAVLAGDGPTRQQCETLIAQSGLASRVALPGSLAPAEVAELLRRSAVACLPSLWEGMPGFVMEAMACAVPVVAARVNGPDALVLDGETGLLVPPLEPAELASALRRLLEDPDLAERLGAAGRRRIEERFDLDGMVEAKQDLYERVASA
jgi:glycosyltransferase involved in cell wall biosynthesis